MMRAMCLVQGMFVVAVMSAAVVGAQPARRSPGYPPRMSGVDRQEVYKTVGDVQLKLYVFFPNDRKPSTPRPAIVFFFGGGFVGGTPGQFEKHCQYFASRGMVAITADYRVRRRHGTTPLEAIQDGRDAIRWVRTHAGQLGVDAGRIVAAGGSAGGLIAACVGVVPHLDKLDGQGQQPEVSYQPNAMVLFNPAIMGRDVPEQFASARRIMPFYHVRAGLPPAIMFYGTEDRFLAGAQQFQKAAREKGNRCELKTWEGLGHGFFNYGRSGNKPFIETVEAADRFLASLGYLEGEPTVREFVESLSQSRRQQP